MTKDSPERGRLQRFLGGPMVRSPRLIVAARVLAGLNQAELAEASGIPRSVLQALEQGRTDPRNSTLLAVLDALAKRGVKLLVETDRVAWGVYVERGSDAAEPATVRSATETDDQSTSGEAGIPGDGRPPRPRRAKARSRNQTRDGS